MKLAIDIATLTLEEKVRLLFGKDFWSTSAVPHAAIPSVVLSDGPHGVRRQSQSFDHLGLQESLPATCFPLSVAVGNSWDPDQATRVASAIAAEAHALGVHIVLGPGINIKRSPLCGRNFEYYSEDPLLSGVLGAAHVKGLQAQGVGASVKHFAANNQETNRMQISAEVDERTLREIYLPAFERVVIEARPATVMSAYNKVNGVGASENPWLLTALLREEWKYEGVVLSDWGAVNDPVASLRAGLDLCMPGPALQGVQAVLAAVQSGTLDVAVIDTAVRRVLGLTQHVADPTDAAGTCVPDAMCDTHHALAREVAAECAVLLKNDGVLPLQSGQRIAVLGEFARTPRYQGGGSSRVHAARLDNVLDCLQTLALSRNCQVDFATGFSLEDEGDDTGLREAALELARSSDITIVFAGLSEADESEGFDRKDLALPAPQIRLLRELVTTGKKTVVVLSSGGTVLLEDFHNGVQAILAGFLLGQAGGGAIADLLFGIKNPCGRLAETLPMALQDTASYLNFPGEQGRVRYGEGVMVGYRWHETAARAARYPFGHGLSYTLFETQEPIVEVEGPDRARVSVAVTNTGQRYGKHVVQVYVSTEAGPVRRPTRELRAFRKIALEAGETQTLSFELDRRAFAYYDIIAQRWVVPEGAYSIQIANSAADILHSIPLALSGDILSQQLTLDSTIGEWFRHPVVGAGLMENLAAAVPPGKGEMLNQPGLLRAVDSMPMKKLVGMLASPQLSELVVRLMETTAQPSRPSNTAKEY